MHYQFFTLEGEGVKTGNKN